MKSKKKLVPASKKLAAKAAGPSVLLADLRQMIVQARTAVARAVDTGLVLHYWQIGQRIRKDVLREKRAEYGKKIVPKVSAQLVREFGSGYGRRNLFQMIRFAEVFPEPQIVQSLTAQLGWTHFVDIIRLDDPLKRDFYAEMCRIEKWDTRTLRDKIGSMLFERTALSKMPAKLIEKELKELREENKLTPDLVFRDPYFLDFLGLKDTYAEKDLEAAILREMESFILEMGTGFAFVERQKRITVDGVDHYLDLLFYHRQLKRLVAVELKLEDFKPADKGQMEFYLAWLNKHERQDGEESPVGLILCAGKRQETVELLDLGRSGIQVSAYLTKLLPKALLQRKLHEALVLARASLERRSHRQINKL